MLSTSVIIRFQAKSLYYEPNSGTYYYFNNETQQYEFHSQVDLKQLKKDMDKYKKRSGRGHESHEVRGSRRDHDKDSGKTRRWNERNSPRPREKESSSHGKVLSYCYLLACQSTKEW